MAGEPTDHTQPGDVTANPGSAPHEADIHLSPLESAFFAVRGASSMQVVADADGLFERLEPLSEAELFEKAKAEGRETPSRLSALHAAEDEVALDLEAPPLPDQYDADMISALVQDPFRMFVYWRARAETVASIGRLFAPEDATSFEAVLRVTERETERENYYPVMYSGEEWFSVFPDRTYVVEFGVRSPHFGFIRLMAAPAAKTPRGAIAPTPPPQPEYRLSTTRFRRVLTASGFDGRTEALPRERLSEWFPTNLADAYFAAGDGQPLNAEQVWRLPLSIRDIINELLERDGGEMAALALLHYLPGVLRDIYLARLAARGVRVGFKNADGLLEAEYVSAEDAEFEEIEGVEWGDWIEEEEEFDVPGLLRFGVGSSAGSELGSMRTRRRRRLPRRVVRRREVERPQPMPWLPSMERPGSLRLSGGGLHNLLQDMELVFDPADL